MGVCGGGVVDAGVSAGARTGVSVGACAGAGGTRAGAGAVTMRTSVGTGTKVSSGGAAGGFPTAVAGNIKGAPGWCHVTSRENTTFAVSASNSLWRSRP